jgi:hypothetical protein
MKLSNLLLPPPVKARHCKRTFVSSPEDERCGPSRAVIEMALDVVRRTLDVDVSEVSRRMKSTPRWPDVWPGEHYRLLAGFVAHLQPGTVVEIGTHTGLSALALKQCLPRTSRLVTFDLIEWAEVPGTCLLPEDFEDGRLSQTIADLADPDVFGRHADVLSSASLIFADGPKDKVFEPAFARNLDSLSYASPPWVIFDDIRDLNMLQFWRDIEKPKLDLSSFGHWTGTGLVHWIQS